MPKLDIQKPVPVERKVFAKNLKDARITAGFSLQELAASAKLTYQYISDVERYVANISLLSMCALSYSLKVPVHALLNPLINKIWDANDASAWEVYQKRVIAAKPAVLEQELLAKNVRRYRKEAGLTQKEVDQLGYYKTGMTSDIERQCNNMTLDKMARLATILSKPLYHIFDPNY
jgi:transcriptional regulator with XRE-family HTH domain